MYPFEYITDWLYNDCALDQQYIYNVLYICCAILFSIDLKYKKVLPHLLWCYFEGLIRIFLDTIIFNYLFIVLFDIQEHT